MIFLGVFVLGLVIYKNIKNIIYEKKKLEYVYTSEALCVNDLFKDKYDYVADSSVVKLRYTAFFVVASYNCAVCVKQFQIINDLLSDERFKNEYNKALLVLDTNKIHGKWFARANPLKINAINISSIELINNLIKFNEDTHDKQLIIVNNLSHKIVLRVKIKIEAEISTTELKSSLALILQNIKK